MKNLQILETFKLFLQTKDLSAIDFIILGKVAKKPSLIKNIVSDIKVGNSNATAMLDKLESRGLIKRVLCAKDRRSIEIEITRKGTQNLNDFLSIDISMY